MGSRSLTQKLCQRKKAAREILDHGGKTISGYEDLPRKRLINLDISGNGLRKKILGERINQLVGSSNT